jgi:PilZ domain
MTFGKSKGGGRRDAPRADAPLLVLLSTAAADFRAALVNISPSGAQLSAPELPLEREPIVFTAPGVQAYARVIWSDRKQCGIEFEHYLPAATVERLSRNAAGARSTGPAVLEQVTSLI